LEICTRPDYADILRREISSVEDFNYKTITHLPILDSFIKEAVRLNPLDKCTLSRIFHMTEIPVNGLAVAVR